MSRETKKIGLCSIGTSLIDLLFEVNEEQFSRIEIVKSSYGFNSIEEQSALINSLINLPHKFVAGGSGINSSAAFAQLGGRSAVISCVGQDAEGERYIEDLQKVNVHSSISILQGERTGSVVALVTPDGERTMRVHLGAGTKLEPAYINRTTLEDSEWLLLEGYMFANGPQAHQAMEDAVDIVKSSGGKVAISLSDPFIVSNFSQYLKRIIEKCDLVFGNEQEISTLTGEGHYENAFTSMSSLAPGLCLTLGEKGAKIRWQDQNHHVPAYQCIPLDTTGAGDMFAGAFLYGIENGLDPSTAGRAANYLAMKVITQIGPRLESMAQDHWMEVLNK